MALQINLKDIYMNTLQEKIEILKAMDKGLTIQYSETDGETDEWDKDAASYVLKARNHYNEYFNEVDNLRVLGNIYENKELINETTEV